MYTPPAFLVSERSELNEMMRQCHLANFITATVTGPMATPLPLLLDETEGELGVLYGHLARPNPQWQADVLGHGLAVFMGPDAYVTPSWYATKAEHGKVVPTWNYAAVHASGPVEFFDDTNRLLEVVNRLTNHHEASRKQPWTVADAPETFISGQLRGIIGMRMPIVALEGKRKMSQNRPEADRDGVRRGLKERGERHDITVAAMVPT
ncbi:MAG: FMN-binding negative transcriptional regulator [Rhizobium sp.]|nr:FMN-binding negative transcriptional regulator [Rhizobium sp.]